MRIIRNIHKARLKNSVVALGNFDGVHLGHKKILEAAAKFAKKNGITSVALTFDPHPQQVICPERGLRLLTSLWEREHLIADAGIDALVIIRFSDKVRRLSDVGFVKQYLVKKLSASMVFVGYDYAFGKGRAGQTLHLRRMGRRFGFKVSVIKPVVFSGSVVKSQKVRELLSFGAFDKAVRLLGHPYIVCGRVISGAGRGKTLGFPTANLKVDERKLLPLAGVYAGHCFIAQKRFRCVVNIGARPTFPKDGPAFEVHLLNFHKDIKGRTIRVMLAKRLRDEMQFSDVEALKRQIKRDVARASSLI